MCDAVPCFVRLGVQGFVGAAEPGGAVARQQERPLGFGTAGRREGTEGPNSETRPGRDIAASNRQHVCLANRQHVSVAVDLQVGHRSGLSAV